MALPEKMSTTQTVLLYSGMGLIAIAAVWTMWRKSPCATMRRSFEENWKLGQLRDARKVLNQASAYGCGWPASVAREAGME